MIASGRQTDALLKESLQEYKENAESRPSDEDMVVIDFQTPVSEPHSDNESKESIDSEAKYELLLPQEEIDKQRIADLKMPGRFAFWGTMQILMVPPLFINAVRRFFEFQPYLLDQIQKIKYYTCSLHPEVIKAISYDGATVSAEGFGFTTTIVFLTGGETIVLLGYQAARYFRDRKKINELVRLVAEHGFENASEIRYLKIDSSQLDTLLAFIKTNPSDELIRDVIKTRLFGFSSPQELNEFSNRVARNATQDAIIDAITTPKKSWVPELHWYRSQLNLYMTPIMTLGTMPGLAMMIQASLKMSQNLKCDLSTVVLNTCAVSDHYDMLSLESYPWMTASSSWLSFLSMGMLARLITIPFPNFRSRVYERIHEPFEKWQKDEKKWRIQTITWEIMYALGLPSIVSYASYQAISLLDRYAKEIGCESVLHLLGLVFSNQLASNDQVCTAADVSMAIPGFLGDFEIGKIYTLYAGLRLLSYLVGATLGRFSCLQKDDAIQRMDGLLQQLKLIHANSMKVATVGCVTSGVVFSYYARQLAENVLSQGLDERYSLSDFRSFNGTHQFDNTTLTDIENYICPFDQIDLRNLTLSANSSLPIAIINNSTLVFSLVSGCKDYNIFSVFFESLAKNITECSAPLIARIAGTFVGCYWTLVSCSTMAPYLVAHTLQIASKTVGSLVNHLRGCKEPVKENIEEKSQHKSYLCGLSQFFKCKRPTPETKPIVIADPAIRLTL